MTVALVAGAVANKHRHGGEAWVRMSWATGLRALGFDVVFVEELQSATCVGPGGERSSFRASANLAAFRRVMEDFGFADRCALVADGGEDVWGMGWDDLLDTASAAELLVNVSGHLQRPEITGRVAHRAYVDIDPGFTQIWHAQGNGNLAGHDSFFTIGELVGTADCSLPTGGIDWIPVRQPVVLDDWPVTTPPSQTRFTTVATWRNPFGRLVWDGTTYGIKLDEFRRFVSLPRASELEFAVALDIDPAEGPDLALLDRNGWLLLPAADTSDTAGFRRFVQESAAEFSVAQGVYVATRCGWFSDRTVRYLASGRPALVQDTGFSETLPTGRGLVAFRTLEEAVAGARDIAEDYAGHCAAARRLAAEHFAADAVLGTVVEATGVRP